METNYDFTKGEKGKFFRKDAVFNFPVYLEPDINEFLSKLASEKNIDMQTLVNEWLRNNIRLLQTVQ